MDHLSVRMLEKTFIPFFSIMIGEFDRWFKYVVFESDAKDQI